MIHMPPVQVVSITTHSGFIAAFEDAIGRPRYSMHPGGVLVVLFVMSLVRTQGPFPAVLPVAVCAKPASTS